MKSNKQSSEILSEFKVEGRSIEDLNKLFQSKDDALTFPSNIERIDEFIAFYNRKQFDSIYINLSSEYRKQHSDVSLKLFLSRVMKEYGIINAYSLNAKSYSLSDNIKYYVSKEDYEARFAKGTGYIIFYVDMFDSLNTSIDEVGFQIDSNLNSKLFGEQTNIMINLLNQKKYVKLNELSTMEYKTTFDENNFENLSKAIFNNKIYKQLHTFVKQKDDMCEAQIIYGIGNKFLTVTLEIDSSSKFRINDFKIVE